MGGRGGTRRRRGGSRRGERTRKRGGRGYRKRGAEGKNRRSKEKRPRWRHQVRRRFVSILESHKNGPTKIFFGSFWRQDVRGSARAEAFAARSRRTSSTPTPFRVRISSAIASASSAPRAETPRWNSAAEGANRARRGDAPAPVLFAGLFLPRNVARGRLVEARPGRGEPRRGPRASASAEATIAPRGNARRGRGRPRGWNRGAASRARRGVFCEECDTRDNENFPRQRGASGRAKIREIVATSSWQKGQTAS